MGPSRDTADVLTEREGTPAIPLVLASRPRAVALPSGLCLGPIPFFTQGRRSCGIRAPTHYLILTW